MNELPPELNLPNTCPQCGEGWAGFGTSSRQVTLFCDQNHLYRRASTGTEVLAFELAVNPDQLLAKEVWLVGAAEPWPRMPPLPAHAAVPGFIFNINDQSFVVVSVEGSRVWIESEYTANGPEMPGAR